MNSFISYGGLIASLKNRTINNVALPASAKPFFKLITNFYFLATEKKDR
jgi:hypothetical protein